MKAEKEKIGIGIRGLEVGKMEIKGLEVGIQTRRTRDKKRATTKARR